MKVIAIIPARGGSKRIPRKNMKNFLGSPIISYAIKLAIESKLFDEVMVSTDDKEIAEIALKFGAKVPFYRSQKNSNDNASTFDALEEVINEYKAIGKFFDYACCIYPCTPLLHIENLEKAFEKLRKNSFDVVFPVISFSYPIQRALIFENDRIEFVHPQNALTRTQDLKSAYHDSGQFYFFNVNSIIQEGNLITANAGAVILNQFQVQDIDNLDDWKLAELKFQLLTK